MNDLASFLEPPGWARQLVRGEDRSEWREVAPSIAVRTVTSGEFAFVSARVSGAVRMSALRIQQATVAAYDSIASQLAGLSANHAVRIWNFIPRILAPLGELPHRYMAFNAGRFAVYTTWYRTIDEVRRRAATASAVGHSGEDLLVHCLAANRPGRSLENPRQIPSYGYSDRYGPMPPCFARATCLRFPGDRDVVLVGGTASVTGEDTIHSADLPAQVEEIFLNLAALVGCAEGVPVDACMNGHCSELLERFRNLRVYVVRRRDVGQIRNIVERRFRSLDGVEYVHADLCRPDLLLEIEGVADVRRLAEPAAGNGRHTGRGLATP